MEVFAQVLDATGLVDGAVSRYFFCISGGQRWDGIRKYGGGTLGPLNRLLGLTTVQPLSSAEEGDMAEASASVLPLNALLVLLLEVSSGAAESVEMGILDGAVLGNLDGPGESVAARGGGLGEGWWALIGEAAAKRGF